MAGTTYVHNFGVNALKESIGSPKAKVDLDRALLIGRDATTGEWVKATNASGSVLRASSVVIEGSLSKAGSAQVDNSDRPMYAGKAQDKEEIFILDVPAGTFTFAEVSQRIPIYLGVDGAWTKTLPTGTGTLVQKVGYVYDTDEIRIRLDLDPQGKILA